MTRLPLLATASLAVMLASGQAQAADRIKFDFWYGLTGPLGEVVQKHCDLFNQSQDKYEAVCTGQGGYDKAEQNTIAAYRAKQQPTVVQIYDAGTVNFLLSGAVVPAPEFAKAHGIDVDWKAYFSAIANFYGTSAGEMWSFPYNSSTAVMYWNKGLLAKIGKTEAPSTFEEFGADLKALKAAGVACPFATDFDTWPILEQFSAIHNIPVASKDNGYGGLDAELVFNKTKFADLVKDMTAWVKDGEAVIMTQQTGKTKSQGFADGSCAFMFNSIADHSTITKTAVEGLTWAPAMIPVYQGFERHNSTIGGASLWVMKGKTDAEYEAAAAFLKYVTAPETGERYIAENTGYIPVTTNGFKLLTDEGFYKDPAHAGRELAIASLTATEPGPLTHGLRLGNFTSIRTAIRSELEAAFTGKKDPQVALDDAVAAGNDILRRYEQTFQGVALP